MDLVFWRARQQAQGQQFWIPPLEWTQTLTHKPSNYTNKRGITRLRQPMSEKDHAADPDRPDEWVQATAATRDTSLHTASHKAPDDDLSPPPTSRDHPRPKVWYTILERRHYYLVHAAATSHQQQNVPWVLTGMDTMIAPGCTPHPREQ